jgi:hypothetical protein
MSDQGDPGSALRAGWHRSLEACSSFEPLPLYRRVWRRHHWKLIALAFLLLEVLTLGVMGGTIGVKF